MIHEHFFRARNASPRTLCAGDAKKPWERRGYCRERTLLTCRVVTRSTRWHLVVASIATIAIACVAGCSVDREDQRETGIHPAGWADLADTKNANFHATHLRDNKYPLADCRTCHGSDYGGGAVGVSCASAKCHSGKDVAGERPAVNACNNCHGKILDPDTRPMPERGRPLEGDKAGAHAKHGRYCDTCHVVPKALEDPGHTDATELVKFSGMAVTGGLTPSWDKASGKCSDTYCHGGKGKSSPVWTTPTTTPTLCTTCHEAPPKSHDRWKRLTADGKKCASCHPEADPDASKDFFAEPSHLDGVVQMAPKTGCSTCHGTTPEGAPPVAVNGSTKTSDRGVGAHQRHLDALLGDRIGRAVACTRCHDVPKSVTQPGHLDAVSPVRLGLGESFDLARGSCVNDCHWSKSPGPVWNDDSGAARKCDACHAFPPDRTRTGTIHPNVAPDVAVCRKCHVFEPATHVDGRVDFTK